MIKQTRSGIEAYLEKAIDQAADKNEGQLISITEKINDVDLIDVFKAAKQLNENRYFWANPSRDFMMIGVGESAEIIAEHNRFEVVKKKWERLVEGAMIYNPYENHGTGLVAFGGMSFDPQEQQTALWEKFAPIHLVLATYTIVKSETDFFLTMTMTIREQDQPYQIIRKFNEDKATLLRKTPDFPEGSKIMDKQEIAPEKWLEQVEHAIQTINQEQVNKIVLARELRLHMNKRVAITPLLQKLLKVHHESYVFIFEQAEDCFIGATPERLIKFAGKQLRSTCLAGTAPRGETEADDEAMAEYLLTDDKNREEHRYVVQMIRNRLEKHCVHVYMPTEPIVHTLRNLHHLYTPVSAQMKENVNVFDIIKELHPTPALGGSPKEKALQFIREHEPLDRGWYGAPIGWLDSEQNGEFAVAIRSSLIQGKKASLFAGCGVMKDSDPQVEYKETNLKFQPMLSVLEDANESY